jgi:hypothetical protein
MVANGSNMPEFVAFLLAQPNAQRLVGALLEGAAWIASPDAERHPVQRAQIVAELGNLVQLEREIRMMQTATETRWDGRSSAFTQADAIAHDDRIAWFESLARLADALDTVRAAEPPAP